MAIFEGAVSGATNLLGAIGLDWVAGAIVPAYTPVFVDLAVPDFFLGGPVFHTGSFGLLFPNESVEHASIAFALAQEALVTIELAVALQTIMDPKGGIRIKDALDPYHYNVVKNALAENNEPVPVPANPGATTLSKLGGAITETGLFSGIAAAAGTMKSLSSAFNFLKLLPQTTAIPPGVGMIPSLTFAGLPNNTRAIQTDVRSAIPTGIGSGMPSNSLALKISASAITIKTAALGYIVSLFRNSIDTTAQALILKNVLDDFSVAVSANAISKAGGTPPAATVQEGEEGIF
jgi:hypothetical protein